MKPHPASSDGQWGVLVALAWANGLTGTDKLTVHYMAVF